MNVYFALGFLLFGRAIKVIEKVSHLDNIQKKVSVHSCIVNNSFPAVLLPQLDALKRTVDRTVTDLESTRSQVTQLKKEVQDKENRYVCSWSKKAYYFEYERADQFFSHGIN
ncbi:hypothetical protein DPMN_140805 [Dreissena polymorpha]|uniref:Uncharacterized protein n=1 Tax=Dreissena polymorpha TaxID=45954 RepID=A0A9D4JHQ6_DREPO|nr:hypothetical protein DPMN_140805 [Dreissena polymorpha]